MTRLDLDTANTIVSAALHKAREMKTAPLAVSVTVIMANGSAGDRFEILLIDPAGIITNSILFIPPKLFGSVVAAYDLGNVDTPGTWAVEIRINGETQWDSQVEVQ